MTKFRQILAEDNAHLTKKPILTAEKIIEIDSHHPVQAALEDLCVGWEAVEEVKEESLFLQNGPFSGGLATSQRL